MKYNKKTLLWLLDCLAVWHAIGALWTFTLFATGVYHDLHWMLYFIALWLSAQMIKTVVASFERGE